ncbi:integrase arm-type DNA-binding domain-containing protein [uncultured Parasphingorhabdus sp.]|uniref:tyrosine-type recombinase/integrase n=1 Tax=uncultured Parasphingorhabdus sp. TaxID=2709694 RepID=UPI002AA85481|nr:integrase arm-type DNA-binding domain-containing protein [uncultured Parasphingorhabdus sp.]
MASVADAVEHEAKRDTITDKAIAKLKAEPGKRLEWADTVVPQLRLRVSQKGAKHWSVVYRVSGAGEGGKKGKMRRMSLGDYPRVTIAKARDGARDALDQAEKGIDPAHQRQVDAVARNERTFEIIAERFVEEYAKEEQKEWKSTKAYLDNYVVPHWRGRQVEEIKRSDVNALLVKVRAQGIKRARERAEKAKKPRTEERYALSGLSAAREVRKRLRTLFNWAGEEDLVIFNPAAVMPSKKKKKSLAYTSRKRALSLEELRRVWDAAEEIGYRYGRVIQLLILTGQRRSEIAKLNTDWLNRDKWTVTVPPLHYKTNIEHTYPLSAPAIAIIEALPSYQALPKKLDKTYYLFPTNNGDRPINGFSKGRDQLHAKIAELGEKEGLPPLDEWQVRDIRRSVKTEMSRLGVPHLHSEQVLGHVLPGIESVYDVHDYLGEKRAALDLWGEQWT